MNLGCIPSKSLLNASEMFHKAQKEFKNLGIETSDLRLNLSKMMAENNEDVQLIGRHEESLKNISSETGFKYSVVDVLDNAKIENLKNEFANDEIEYLGDIKFTSWLSLINCAPTPSLLPVGFKKNQTSRLTLEGVNLCLYQYFNKFEPDAWRILPTWELPLNGNSLDGT